MASDTLSSLRTRNLDAPSRLIVDALIGHVAEDAATARTEPGPGGTVRVSIDVPSPTNDRGRDLAYWIDEREVPSLSFGAWHTHADLWDLQLPSGVARMVAYSKKIIDGAVLLHHLRGAVVPSASVIEIVNDDDVLELLTRPGMSGELLLLSWSGKHDRVVRTDTMDCGG